MKHPKKKKKEEEEENIEHKGGRKHDPYKPFVNNVKIVILKSIYFTISETQSLIMCQTMYCLFTDLKYKSQTQYSNILTKLAYFFKQIGIQITQAWNIQDAYRA